jgi:hypothetical protein
MTKYILAGGADRKFKGYGENLATEIFKAVNQPIHFLSCFFAEPREEWESKFADRLDWFRQNFGKNGRYELAFPDRFIDQLKASNVVYIHGGDDDLLTYRLSQFKDLERLFEGKVVVGSSAGADWLSSNFWTCDWREVRRGSGLTGLNIIPHFESEEYGMSDPRGPINWKQANTELQTTIGAGKAVTLLREGEFIVVEL